VCYLVFVLDVSPVRLNYLSKLSSCSAQGFAASVSVRILRDARSDLVLI
jgi:hypothetical protein